MTATQIIVRKVCGERLLKLSGESPEWTATINDKKATFEKRDWHEPVAGTNRKRKIPGWQWSIAGTSGWQPSLIDAVRRAQHAAHAARQTSLNDAIAAGETDDPAEIEQDREENEKAKGNR